MNIGPRLDYDQLVASYHESLTTILRGFRSTEAVGFLETWVPDDDAVKSLFDIVEAAKGSGCASLAIAIGSKTLAGIEVERLKMELGQLGSVQIDTTSRGADLTVVFGETSSVEDLHPSYRSALRVFLSDCRHEGPLATEPEWVVAQATAEGIALRVAVDPSTHVILRARFEGASSGVQRGLLEGMCRLLEGHPIQEGSEHVIIRLEATLRDPVQPRPVRGIVLPQNADPAFLLPLKLIRAAFGDYKRQTGYHDVRNFYDWPMSDDWRALTQEQRLAQVKTAVGRHPAGEQVEVVRMEGSQRVVLRFHQAIDAATKRQRLLMLEAHLKCIVEPTLYVYLEPKLDANKPRQNTGVPR